MDAGKFTTRYPEFTTVDPDTIGAILQEAARAVNADLFGVRTDDAVMALAAHKIFVSPAGMPMRSESDQLDTSYYLKAYQTMRREVAPKFLVL